MKAAGKRKATATTSDRVLRRRTTTTDGANDDSHPPPMPSPAVARRPPTPQGVAQARVPSAANTPSRNRNKNERVELASTTVGLSNDSHPPPAPSQVAARRPPTPQNLARVRVSSAVSTPSRNRNNDETVEASTVVSVRNDPPPPPTPPPVAARRPPTPQSLARVHVSSAASTPSRNRSNDVMLELDSNGSAAPQRSKRVPSTPKAPRPRRDTPSPAKGILKRNTPLSKRYADHKLLDE